MLWIRVDFRYPIYDDIPTDEELFIRDSIMELDEENDPDDPDLGAEAYVLETDDDIDDA